MTVLDVRPPDEFALGHVPGAVNIPLRALKERLREINPDREIVAYCRGEYCVLSFEAVALLRARGLKVRRLPEMAGCRIADQCRGLMSISKRFMRDPHYSTKVLGVGSHSRLTCSPSPTR